MVNLKNQSKSTAVLATRPSSQNFQLMDKLRHLKYLPVELPALKIEPIQTISDYQFEAILPEVDMLIVITRNAIESLPDSWCNLLREKTKNIEVMTMGEATTETMQAFQLLTTYTAPKGIGSEALLEQDFLSKEALLGKTVAILTGEGGRAILQQTLEQRGAKVETWVVYRRACPTYADVKLILAPWLSSKKRATLITCNTSLDNLLRIFPKEYVVELKNSFLVVPSYRVADYAKRCGCHQVVVAESARDDDMIKALQAF